jgi:hypothetical protein
MRAAAAFAPEPFVHAGPRAPLYYAAVGLLWRFPRRRAAWAAGAALLAGSLLGR